MKQPTGQMMRASQAGVTILEFIAFIGLAAVVLAGALGLYRAGSQSSTAQQVGVAANAFVNSARAAGASGDFDWSQLCIAGTTSATACPQSAVQIPGVAGWVLSGTTNGAFKKGTVTMQFAGAANTTKTLSVTMSDTDSAATLAKITVGGVTGTVSGNANNIVSYSGMMAN